MLLLPQHANSHGSFACSAIQYTAWNDKDRQNTIHKSPTSLARGHRPWTWCGRSPLRFVRGGKACGSSTPRAKTAASPRTHYLSTCLTCRCWSWITIIENNQWTQRKFQINQTNQDLVTINLHHWAHGSNYHFIMFNRKNQNLVTIKNWSSSPWF